MAYTITQEPGLFAGTGQAIVFVAYDTETANIYPDGDADVFKYRYVCDIYVNTVKVARLKQLPNANSRGVFDVSKIVNSYLYPTKTNANDTTKALHLIPYGATTKPFSHNDSTIESVICKFGYEKSTSLTTTPTVTADVVAEDVVYCIQASFPFALTDTSGNYPLSGYEPDGIKSRFLTNMPIWDDGEAISVSANEWRTMAFLNEETACQLDRLYVQIFNSSDVILNTSFYYFTNSSSSGGAIPGSETNTDPERLLYVGIGPKNLNTQTIHDDIKIESHPTAAYYKVFGTNSSNTQKTAIYRFNLDGDDCYYPMVELIWKNRLGAWDYYTFRKKDTIQTNITRTSMKRPVGKFNDTLYTENVWNRGTETLITTATKRGIVNTDYVSEKVGEWLEDLFTSNDVYFVKTFGDFDEVGSQWTSDLPQIVPVVIESTSFIKKTHTNDKCQIQYTIEYSYSHSERTNI
jgi:hypothetical protein